MPIIQCDIRRGRTEEQLTRLAKSLTRAVQEITGEPLDTISVIVREWPGPKFFEAGVPSPDYVPAADGRDLAGLEEIRSRTGKDV